MAVFPERYSEREADQAAASRIAKEALEKRRASGESPPKDEPEPLDQAPEKR